MNILILTQNFAPEPDAKMFTLGAGLVRLKHSVTVVTGLPNYPYGRIYEGYKQRLWQFEEMDGIKVIRLPIYADKSSSFVRRSLNYLSFPFFAAILGPILTRNIQVVFVYHPPVTLAIPAWILSLVHRAPFIYEIQDMWPETLTATGMVRNPAVIKILSMLAMFAYRKAASITVLSPGFKRNLEAKGVPGKKINVFYNWAYEAEFPQEPYDSGLAESLGLRNRFNILYAGNVGPAQGLQNVIEAASMLADIRDLQFVLVGDGIEKARLRQSAQRRQICNVLFIDRMPISKMPSLYSVVDAVMVHLTTDPLFEITVPGKTQSCLLSGKPVIASVNGDAAKLVSEAKAGFAVAAMDPKALAEAIRKFYYMPFEERASMGRSGRTYYDRHLSPEVQIRNYEKLIKEVAFGEEEKHKHKRGR